MSQIATENVGQALVLRPQAKWKRLSWALIVAFVALYAAIAVSVVGDLDTSIVDDVRSFGDSKVLGAALVALFLLPGLVFPALYLSNLGHELIRLDDAGMAVDSAHGNWAVAWNDVVALYQVQHITYQGDVADAGWRIDSSEAENLRIGNTYGEPLKDALRKHLAPRGIRMQVMKLE